MSIAICGGRKCCPTMDKKEGKYIITDDFGGKVKLEEEEVKNILKAKAQLDKNEG